MPGLGGPPAAAPPEPRPILELDGEEREDELDALSDWVDDFLLPVYGAEVTTAAPWCLQWQEHDDVVAWLHALWLAYQQHKDPEAGLSRPVRVAPGLPHPRRRGDPRTGRTAVGLHDLSRPARAPPSARPAAVRAHGDGGHGGSRRAR